MCKAGVLHNNLVGSLFALRLRIVVINCRLIVYSMQECVMKAVQRREDKENDPRTQLHFTLRKYNIEHSTHINGAQ